MFCKECGTKLEEGTKFCPQCGTPISQTTSKSQGERGESEVILMQGLCNRVKNPLYVQNGNAILTNKRFLYVKMIPIKLLEEKFDLEIPIDQIALIEDGRQGISKTLVIITKDGKRYNFYVTKREEWKSKLHALMTDLSQR